MTKNETAKENEQDKPIRNWLREGLVERAAMIREGRLRVAKKFIQHFKKRQDDQNASFEVKIPETHYQGPAEIELFLEKELENAKYHLENARKLGFADEKIEG